MSNTFGHLFKLHTFGESHGPALGAIIDGCPAGVPVDLALLRDRLARRRPGANTLVSARAEPDEVEILSGVYDGHTLGTPIAALVRNRDARSEDYSNLAPRTGHADDVWRAKFGWSDPRGGGRSSGRETLARVIGGAFAEMFLAAPGAATAPEVVGFARSIGPLALSDEELARAHASSRADIDGYAARFPSSDGRAVTELLERAKSEGKSYGGVAEIVVRRAPAHLGQPVFTKFKSELAAAFLSLGATSGVELGAGFAAAVAEGSEFHARTSPDGRYGGIRGGITTGEDITARVAFKPTASVLDVAKKGRHDPCIVPRAIPVLEAMAYLVLADQVLLARADRA